MKNPLRFLSTLLILALGIGAFSQDNVVVELGYMKIKPGNSGKYLEVEKEWKKIHEARLEKGYILGWQLWQKMYSGASDEYNYITVNWYESMVKTAKPGYRVVVNDVFTDEEMEKLSQKTTDARVYVRTDVMHRLTTVENSKPTKFIVVSQMKPSPGKASEYIKMETEIFKPLMEEAIERGEKTAWSLWRKWPFEEGDIRHAIVNGYESFEQLDAGMNYPEILKKVHPDMDVNELGKMVGELRSMPAMQIWRLVDEVMPD